MTYITGLICFGIPCEEDSCGTWMFTKADFGNNKYLIKRDMEESVFKDMGIEKDKIIMYYGDDVLFNVATHSRAYLDLLEMRKFDQLEGVFYNYICSKKCRGVIFREVYNKLRNLDDYKEIHDFMSSEFGNAWASYCYERMSGAEVTVNAECISA